MGQGDRGSTTFSLALCREAGRLDYLALDAFAVIVQDEDPVDSGQGQRLLRSHERWRVAHWVGEKYQTAQPYYEPAGSPGRLPPREYLPTSNQFPSLPSSRLFGTVSMTYIRYDGLALAWANKMILIIAHLTSVDLTTDVTQEFIANSGAFFPPTPVYCSVKVTCPVCFTPI